MIRGIRSRWLLRMRNGESDCQMAEMVVPTVATRTMEDVVWMISDHWKQKTWLGDGGTKAHL